MVYVTGDTHKDFDRFKTPDAKKLKKNDILIVLGDFGFIWEGGSEEEKILNKIAKLKFTVAFLDGPHENFNLLSQFPVIDWNGGKASQIRENIIYLQRGEVYTIGPEKYFAFGGGQSENYELYNDDKTQMEKALPTTSEMEHGADRLEKAGYEVDFILTHEPSFSSGGTVVSTFLPSGVNTYLNQIEQNIDYKKWFFGYLHIDKIVSKRHHAVYKNIIPVGSFIPLEKKKKAKKEKPIKEKKKLK